MIKQDLFCLYLLFQKISTFNKNKIIANTNTVIYQKLNEGYKTDNA